MTKLPRLLNSNLEEVSRLHPISLSITEKLIPLSFASMYLTKDEMLKERKWVELFTPVGSAGIFRTRSPQTGIGSETYSIELDHGIVELGDYIVPATIEGEMTCRKAIQTIFEHYRGKKWKLGKVECTDTVTVDIDYDNLLEAINDILSQCIDYVMKFNFKTTPWTLSIVKKESEVTAEGRLSRNVKTATIKSDDKDLCTRVWIRGRDEKRKDAYSYVNSDTISDYGLVEHVDTGTGYTKTQAELVAKHYLEAHKKPKLSVEISAIELSQITGEELDKFRPGKLFRLAAPSEGITIEDVITTVVWGDVFNNPQDATVSLGDDRDSVLSFYQKQKSASKSAKKSGVNSYKASQEFKTHIEQTDKSIELYSAQTDRANNILKQAGLTLTPDGILMYATDNENSIGSRIDQNASSISLVVEGTGKNAKIKPASIVASINGSKSEIMISADKIKLDGNVDLNSVLYVGEGMARFKKPVFFEGSTRHVSINNGKVTAGGGVQIGANQSLVFLEGSEESQALRTITPTIAGNLIKSAEVSGNTLKLTNVKGDEVTFSKAVASWVLGWSGGKFTATAKPQNQSVWTTIVQGTVSWDGNSATVPIEAYDSDNPSYQYDTGRSVLVDATQRYRSGWAAAYGKVTLPDGGTANAFTIKVPPSTVDGSATTLIYTLSQPTHNLVTLTGNTAAGGYMVASINHKQYDKGWEAAYKKVTLPAGGTATQFSVETPPSEVDGEATVTTYELYEQNKNLILAKIEGTGGRTIASINHKQYNKGWEAAQANVTLPSGGTGNSFDIKVPPSTVDGSATTLTYTLSQTNNNLITVTGNTAAGGYIVASINHGRYNAGIDSIDGDDISLQVYGTTPSGSSPSDTVTWTTLQSGKKHVNAYIWVKRSDGTWARLRSFSSTEP